MQTHRNKTNETTATRIINHTLGFPRIGIERELKKALELYWAGKSTQEALLATGKLLRARHWQQQKEAGIDLIPVGDFAWYDHVLNMSLLLGNVPKRHQGALQNQQNQQNQDKSQAAITLDTVFNIARGYSPIQKAVPEQKCCHDSHSDMPETGSTNIAASEMTKWFNTNYHYIVPEFYKGQTFEISWTQLFDEIDEAQALGYRIKPVILGPISYLWLGKVKSELSESSEQFNRLELLPNLLAAYQTILTQLSGKGIEWVQIDEPALVLDLPIAWQDAYRVAYKSLNQSICHHHDSDQPIKLLLTTYFDSIAHHLDLIKNLPIQGLHVDLVAGKDNLHVLHQQIPKDIILSLGVINGRNVWRADLAAWFHKLLPLIGHRTFWLGTSCSLLHSPIDLKSENLLEAEVKSWFAFALQKCHELKLLTQAFNAQTPHNIRELTEYSALILARQSSERVHNRKVQARLQAIKPEDYARNHTYPIRAKAQREKYALPVLPTTTIGSFPQTGEIRSMRRAYKQKNVTWQVYETTMNTHIAQAIVEQEALGLDVLVHGEAERNDMVEYFGEHLDGFVFTENAWVQSYGSRCVKPPIIIGDISRSNPITVKWATYAQSLTQKPVKGMLTGPVTILCWSFPREDVAREIIATQIALALRDEVDDLQKSGIGIIQIDEPALREGLPLYKAEWRAYLNWAVNAFKLNAAVAWDETQIHTHMCYCEFNDIMSSIAGLDADVITIETSRSDMELLHAFKTFAYPNEIGPGVYDIHSPNVPSVKWMYDLINKAALLIPLERLWVNPDCGLKTRSWEETRAALSNMVTATQQLRLLYRQQI